MFFYLLLLLLPSGATKENGFLFYSITLQIYLISLHIVLVCFILLLIYSIHSEKKFYLLPYQKPYLGLGEYNRRENDAVLNLLKFIYS